MTQRLLFLDIDGVLNSTRSFIALQGAGYMPRRITQLSPQRIRQVAKLDEVAVGILKRITEQSGCQLVLASTWRMGQDVLEINCLMRAYDLPNVVGRTQVSHDGCRGDEIQDYLNTAVTLRGAAASEPDDYVILDDDGDMLESQMSHLIQCDASIGLALPQYLAIEVRWFPSTRGTALATATAIED